MTVKRVFRYLKGDGDYFLCYLGNNLFMKEHTNVDWGSDLNERKSIFGYTFLLNNGVILWYTKK